MVAPTDRLKQADELKEAKQVEQAISSFQTILAETSNNEQVLKEQEYALGQLGQIYRDLQ